MLWTEFDDKRVSGLDPLCADSVMQLVPQWNADANVSQLADTARSMCLDSRLEIRTHEEVMAIVRDIGILIGSLRRHGADPVCLVPELERTLVLAGTLTDLVPRDTLMHYTVWNPADDRLRRYTAHPQEFDLIASIRKSLPAIRDATRHLFEMRDYALHHQRTFRSAHRVAHCLKHFLFGLHHAMRHVEPAVFIQHFRPFFEPIRVGAIHFRGPGAVTMPLHVFDFLLWGSSEQDAQYQRFTSDYIPYNTSEFRQYYHRVRNTPSLVDRLELSLTRSKSPVGTQALVSPVIVCMKRVRAFRNAHLKYAIKAYHGSTKHTFATGSGGHTTSDLERLSELTDKHFLRLEALRHKCFPTDARSPRTTSRVPALVVKVANPKHEPIDSSIQRT